MSDLRFFIERLDAEAVAGWCFDPASPLERLAVEVQQGGRTLGTGHADVMRADLARVGYGDGACGFYVPLANAAAGETVRIVLSGERHVCQTVERTLD